MKLFFAPTSQVTPYRPTYRSRGAVAFQVNCSGNVYGHRETLDNNSSPPNSSGSSSSSSCDNSIVLTISDDIATPKEATVIKKEENQLPILGPLMSSLNDNATNGKGTPQSFSADPGDVLPKFEAPNGRLMNYLPQSFPPPPPPPSPVIMFHETEDCQRPSDHQYKGGHRRSRRRRHCGRCGRRSKRGISISSRFCCFNPLWFCFLALLILLAHLWNSGSGWFSGYHYSTTSSVGKARFLKVAQLMNYTMGGNLVQRQNVSAAIVMPMAVFNESSVDLKN